MSNSPVDVNQNAVYLVVDRGTIFWSPLTMAILQPYWSVRRISSGGPVAARNINQWMREIHTNTIECLLYSVCACVQVCVYVRVLVCMCALLKAWPTVSVTIWPTVITHNVLLCQVNCMLGSMFCVSLTPCMSVCMFICVFLSMYVLCVGVGMHVQIACG